MLGCYTKVVDMFALKALYSQDAIMFSGLQIAAAVADRLQEKHEGSQEECVRYPALQHLGRGIKDALPQLRQRIRHCIEVSSYGTCSGLQVWCI